MLLHVLESPVCVLRDFENDVVVYWHSLVHKELIHSLIYIQAINIVKKYIIIFLKSNKGSSGSQ